MSNLDDNQQILEKAINRAIDGGWKNDYDWRVFNGDLANLDHDHVPEVQLLFNHDFAKALWGDKELSPYYGDMEAVTAPDLLWEWHLQQMVIADDPIKYLGKNI